jgi:hypothetical protein
MRGRVLRSSANSIPYFAFQSRKQYLSKNYEAGTYIKSAAKTNPAKGDSASPPNPMGDPMQMEAMMDGMKKNMVMMIPQMVIMGWITYFFSGFVLSKTIVAILRRFLATEASTPYLQSSSHFP